MLVLCRFNLPIEVFNEFKIVCNKQGTNMSKVLRAAVEQYINEHTNSNSGTKYPIFNDDGTIKEYIYTK